MKQAWMYKIFIPSLASTIFLVLSVAVYLQLNGLMDDGYIAIPLLYLPLHIIYRLRQTSKISKSSIEENPISIPEILGLMVSQSSLRSILVVDLILIISNFTLAGFFIGLAVS